MVEGQVRLRHSELSGHYSSAVFLLFTIFTTIYGLLAYFSFVKFIRVSRDYENVWIALASVSVVFRTLAIILAWIIWLTKAGMGGKAPSQAFHQRFNVWLPYLQAAYPLTTIAALIFRLTMHLLIGKCHNGIADGFCNPHAQCGGMSATLSAELMSFPILVAFLLRDTRFEALLIAWLTAVSVLISFCVLLESPDLIISTVGYVFFSVLLCWDNESHHRELCTVLQELKQALVENEQLAQAAQALELRAMIGNVAHDMKTPLMSILSSIECMVEIVTSWEVQDTSARQVQFLERARGNLTAIRKCLQEMKSTTAFMTMSINRCLDYTKANAGMQLVPRLETVYLRSLLEMPMKMMREMLNHRSIALVTLDDSICTHIITDKQWLLENLLCLLSNAVKYSTKGSVDVAVYLVPAAATSASDESKESGGDGGGDEDPTRRPVYLRFEVLDTGVGISDEAMAALFSPFKQAQRMAGGTGLGLFSLAKRVEALHGQYGVNKRPDGAQGSLFWFTLPYRPDELAAQLNSESSVASSTIISLLSDDTDSPRHRARTLSASASGSVAANGSSAQECYGRDPSAPRYSVLVVDNSPMTVRMTTVLLTRMGHTMQHAVDGADALEMILNGYSTSSAAAGAGAGTASAGAGVTGASQYDVVLMDLQLPIMDGLLVIRRVRAAEKQLRDDEEVEKEKEKTRKDHQPQYQQQQHSSDRRGTSSSNWEAAKATQHENRFSFSSSGDDDLELGLLAGMHRIRSPLALSIELSPPTPSQQQQLRHHQYQHQYQHRRFHQFIIAVSANSDQQAVQGALSAGADAFMVKPFSYESFAELMERHT